MASNVFLIYCFLLVYSGGATSGLIILFLMEFLSWIFLMILEKFSSLKYLLIQSVFFISCLFLMMWELKLVFIPILIKMGIPPFHFWLMNILSYLKTFSFIFMMTIHKVFPLWFFSMVVVGSYSIILIASLLLLGSMIILQMIKIYYLLMVSSMVHSGWLLMGFSLNPLMGSYYWFFYSGFLSLFFILQKMEMKFYDLNQNFNTSFVFLSISGLPPFCFFWLKVMVMLFFLEKSVLISGLVLISSVMSLSAYFRGFIFSLALNKSVFTALSPFVCVYALMGSF